VREQEMANRQRLQQLGLLSQAAASSSEAQQLANRHLQLSMLTRASNESLALQMLRTQQMQQQQQQHQQQAYGSMMLQQQQQHPHQLLPSQSLLLSQLQAMASPRQRGPPNAMLPSGSPLQLSGLALPPPSPHSATIHPGRDRTAMNLGGSAAVAQPAQDSITSALVASIARDEARRKPGHDQPQSSRGGGGGGGGNATLYPNGCRYHPRAFPVAVEADRDCTSKYQAFLRQQLMYFETVPLDTQASAKGRNKPIKVGQVGIMCRHCRNLLPPKRPRGSVYYPQKLVGVYQSAQNMAKNHFAGSGCSNAPPEVNEELHRLRAEQTSFYGGGQPYWAKSAAMAGIVETEDGLEFAASARPKAGGNGSGSPKG
jgi:hypothetical protein